MKSFSCPAAAVFHLGEVICVSNFILRGLEFICGWNFKAVERRGVEQSKRRASLEGSGARGEARG